MFHPSNKQHSVPRTRYFVNNFTVALLLLFVLLIFLSFFELNVSHVSLYNQTMLNWDIQSLLIISVHRDFAPRPHYHHRQQQKQQQQQQSHRTKQRKKKTTAICVVICFRIIFVDSIISNIRCMKNTNNGRIKAKQQQKGMHPKINWLLFRLLLLLMHIHIVLIVFSFFIRFLCNFSWLAYSEFMTFSVQHSTHKFYLSFILI